MAVYKVLQDIEAEDQFLGPLTLRQFIYAAIAVLCAYISFLGLTKGVWIISVFLLPITLFGGFLAWPWSKDQATEVLLLARIRFFLKPRKRIWDQNGMKQLVTITVPKKIEKHLTNELSQWEVKSRLQALANTIDSRGWAVKNVNVNLFSQPSYVLDQEDSDRLIDPSSIPQSVPQVDITAVDDVLDEESSPTAQHFTQMIEESAKNHRQQAVSQMKSAEEQPATTTTPADYWFMNSPPAPQPGSAAFNAPPVISPGTPSTNSQTSQVTAEEEDLLKKIHQQESQPDPTNYHMRNIEPHSKHAGKKAHTPSNNSPVGSAPKKAQAGWSATPDPAILELASNDDLNVATIARQADKVQNQPPQDEVVISLR